MVDGPLSSGRTIGRTSSVLKRLHLWLPPLAYMVLIFHLSSESNPLPELTTRVWDKLLHTAEYGGLGLLVSRAVLGEGVNWIMAVLVAVVLCSVYGATDEWHQAFVPLRSPDVRDWLADTVGSTLGVAVYLVWTDWLKCLSKLPADCARKQRPS